MKMSRIILGALAALALSSALPVQAQQYPYNTPSYTPTAQLTASTFTTTGDYTFVTNGVGVTSFRVVKASGATYTGAAQCSNDNSLWSTIRMFPVGGGAAVSTASASGFWRMDSSACTKVRFHLTAVGGTGGLTVQGAATPSAFPISIDPENGATLTHVLSAATTNSTSVKASPGTVYNFSAVNTNATSAYLKFYDKASAPTCNSDTVLATYTLIQNVPIAQSFPAGAAFPAGIGICITGAAADNDNTSATTGITLSLSYK